MSDEPADLVLEGGSFRCLATDVSTVVDAVAVKAGRIVALGRDAVADRRGPRTRVVDVAGATVLPGFVDAHNHAVAGGMARLVCDLSDVHGLDAYRSLIARYAAEHRGPSVEGSGWYGDAFAGGFPDRHELDRLVPDRPAVFTSHDYHSVWVNSLALARAGVDASTPDPAGGRIVRDAAGEPTGLLLEAAGELVRSVREPVDAARLARALLQAEAYLHSLGVTSWQDALVGEFLAIPDTFDTYVSLSGSGRLRSRVTGSLWWPSEAPDDHLGTFEARRAQAAGRFRATAVKIVQDGVCENLTAALLSAYNGRPDETGMSFMAPERLAEVARLVAGAGFDLHMHAVGDRAVAECLDAVDGLAERTPDARHQVAHIDLIAAGDVARMAALGVTANVSPLWARNDPVLVETKLPHLTAEQQERHFLFGTLAAAGVPVAFGSDWPVSSPDPLWAIHTAVNRTAPPGDVHALDERSQSDPLLPGERLAVGQALVAATRTAARAARQDAFVGTIEIGKEADLVVLDRDPLAVPADELGVVRVRATFVRGECVHEAH